MAERITITIPDDLGKRLSAVKDRFNVSRVCAAALQDQVDREETSIELEGASDMEKVKERLKNEKAEFFEGCRKDGRVAGLEDAKEMSYGELYELTSACEACWGEWLEEKIGESEDHAGPFDEDAYLTGWLEGVLEFWREVGCKI